MTLPAPQDFFDPVLSDASIALANEDRNFVGTQVVPMVPVGKETGKYYKFGQEAFLRDDAQPFSGAMESAGGGFSLSTATFSIDPYGIHMDFSEDDRARFASSGGGLDWRMSGVKYVTSQCMLKREQQIADVLFTASNWDTSVTPSNLWSSPTSDPVGDIETGKRAVLIGTGLLPNTLAVGYDVDRYLRHHPQVRGRLGSENPENASRDDVARALNVERYFVFSAAKITSAEGNSSVTGGFVNGNDALLAYFPSAPSLMAPSAAYCFENDGLFMSGSMGIREIPLLHRNNTIRIEGKTAIGPTVTSDLLGYHFEAVISNS